VLRVPEPARQRGHDWNELIYFHTTLVRQTGEPVQAPLGGQAKARSLESRSSQDSWRGLRPSENRHRAYVSQFRGVRRFIRDWEGSNIV
jgi:hypothetical protein